MIFSEQERTKLKKLKDSFIKDASMTIICDDQQCVDEVKERIKKYNVKVGKTQKTKDGMEVTLVGDEKNIVDWVKSYGEYSDEDIQNGLNK